MVEFRCAFSEAEDQWVVNVFIDGEHRMLKHFSTTDEVCRFMLETFDIKEPA